MTAFNPRKPHDYDWDAEPTPPLNLFLVAQKADPNLWFAIGSGHHQNLFEEALERLEPAEGVRDGVIAVRDELQREAGHPERGQSTNIETRRIARRLTVLLNRHRR
jgi:hypothetical protein